MRPPHLHLSAASGAQGGLGKLLLLPLLMAQFWALRLMSIESVMPSSHLIHCRPLLLLSQHQSLFQRVNSSREVAKVLEFQLHHQSFQRTSRTDLL